MARFTIGDRVQMTAEAQKLFITPRVLRHNPNSWKGTVVGGSRDPDHVAILRDGLKERQRYHKSFWEPLR